MVKRVVILGAGVVGAAIAYELSQLDQFEITVLDTAQPARGSTGAALGVLMGIISRKTKGRAWTLRRRSMERFPGLLEELAAADQPVPHNPHGILKLLREPEELEKDDRLRELRQASGWDLAIWDQDTIQQHCPHLQAKEAAGGIFSPQDFQVQPVPFTKALLAVAQQNGAHCYFGISQPKLEITDQHCQKISTDQNSYPCDWLIVSAGLGSLEVTKHLSESLSLGPVLGQAFHLRVPKKLEPQTPFQPVVSFEDIHVVPLGQGEYWVGATVEFPAETGGITPDITLADQVLQKAIAFYPLLKNAEILRHWSGKRPRPNGQGAPVLKGLAGYDNILLATGHYRNGVLLAPATALTIRDWLLAPETIPF
ncbi:NAD(P)/FAD-dependent oxidoreductase [Picosynechococcus sp. PCC 8807]|uniref:NAD(P)/FAD-dependent oxidoreductase n=1 Tax=Picosynechococcus sp. PCC 8807 TaxID=195248 RepID=UPI000810D2E1|nr:FAD-binding oxidoreductase [Picosynechococcus sp. PCC 8807]ANV91300.1 FAD-dependent oxidoreductase [Picosynechococcus sp. PCC 8807]